MSINCNPFSNTEHTGGRTLSRQDPRPFQISLPIGWTELSKKVRPAIQDYTPGKLEKYEECLVKIECTSSPSSSISTGWTELSKIISGSHLRHVGKQPF